MAVRPARTRRTGPLVITLGEFAGVGPELTARVWLKAREQSRTARTRVPPFVVIGPADIAEAALRAQRPDATIARFGCHTPLAEAVSAFSDALPVIELASTDGQPLPRCIPGSPDPNAAPAVIASIAEATRRVMVGEASGLVTNPIDKSVLYRAGFSFPGHTEFLAELCREARAPLLDPVMLLVTRRLRVALATIHMPLREVADNITPDRLSRVARIVSGALRRDFGLEVPRLAFAGLNPHAGEAGTIGDEERTIINPTAARLREEGICISDATPGDTVFHFAAQGAYDAVIAMYHDQGLAALKTLDFWQGVNVTLGLPIVRTSPDHGTAYAAAAERTGRPDSLLAALRLAAAIARRRRAADQRDRDTSA